MAIALSRTAKVLAEKFVALRYKPYATVRGQLLCIWWAVNRARKLAGYKLMSAGGRAGRAADLSIVRVTGRGVVGAGKENLRAVVG